MKKIFSFLLVAALACSMLCVSAFAANGTPSIAIGNASGTAGNQVEVPVYICNADWGDECETFEFTLTYDTGKLTFVRMELIQSAFIQGASNGLSLSQDFSQYSTLTSTSNPVLIKNWANVSWLANTQYAKAVFEVNSNTQEGTYDIGISNASVIDWDGNPIEHTTTNGSITVVAGAPTGYAVSLTALAEVAAGGSVDVALDVTHPTEAAFNAFYATMTYDSNSFTYDTDVSELNGFTVDSTTAGTLKISKVGADAAISTSPDLTLRFTAGESGSGVFKLTSAKVDKQENALSDAPEASIPAAGSTVAISNATVAVSKYCDGYALITVRGDLNEGEVFKCDGNIMYTLPNVSDIYVYVVQDWNNNTVTTATAKTLVTKASGTANAPITHNGDANGTGKVDINDAQFIYNLFTKYYASDLQLSVTKLLEADVNGDFVVNAQDIAAAIAKIA